MPGDQSVSGIKISSFSTAQNIKTSDLITGLQDRENKNFTFGTILAWFRQTIEDFYIAVSEKGRANGVASLDGAGKVTDTQIPFSSNNPMMDGTASAGTATTLSRSDHRHPSDTSKISASEKGAASGVASLGSDGKVPSAQLPTIPSASSATPQNLGTAAAGSSNDYSRADHVHAKPTPADIGAQPSITANGILKGDGAGGVSAAVAGTDYAAPSSIPTAYSSNPEMDGTASPGSGTDYARGNHVHPTDTSRLAADGTAAAAYRLSAAHTLDGATGWYHFLDLILTAGNSRSLDLLIDNSYRSDTGILRIYFNRLSGGSTSGYATWLAGTIVPDDVRWEIANGVMSLYINKRSNANGAIKFSILSFFNRAGNEIGFASTVAVWASDSVSEPTTATAAVQSIKPAIGNVTLTASWSGSGPYTQTVTVTGPPVTANSKVDLQPTAAQIADLLTAGVQALFVENNAGTLTAYAVGAPPTSAMNVQCTVEETV